MNLNLFVFGILIILLYILWLNFETPTISGFKFNPRGICISKPWGQEIYWAPVGFGAKYAGKVLCIEAGSSLGKQYHKVKTRSILILSGKLKIEITDNEGVPMYYYLDEGEAFHIEPMTIYQMTAFKDTQIIEMSTPELDDEVKYEKN